MDYGYCAKCDNYTEQAFDYDANAPICRVCHRDTTDDCPMCRGANCKGDCFDLNFFDLGIASVEPITDDDHQLITMRSGDRIWLRQTSFRPSHWFVTLIMPPIGKYEKTAEMRAMIEAIDLTK